MAKSKAVLALEARLEIAAQVYCAQRARIAELEAQLNTRGVIATPHTIAPIVTHFTKADGSVWEKVRIGNRATSRQVAIN